jgi:hypothetical protein
MKRKFIIAGTALALIFGAAILGSGTIATAQPYGGGGMMGGPGYGYGPGWMHGYRDGRSGYGPGWMHGYSRSGYGPGWMHGYRHGWSGSERRDIYDFGRMHGSGYGRGYGPGWMHQW